MIVIWKTFTYICIKKRESIYIAEDGPIIALQDIANQQLQNDGELENESGSLVSRDEFAHLPEASDEHTCIYFCFHR